MREQQVSPPRALPTIHVHRVLPDGAVRRTVLGAPAEPAERADRGAAQPGPPASASPLAPAAPAPPPTPVLGSEGAPATRLASGPARRSDGAPAGAAPARGPVGAPPSRPAPPGSDAPHRSVGATRVGRQVRSRRVIALAGAGAAALVVVLVGAVALAGGDGGDATPRLTIEAVPPKLALETAGPAGGAGPAAAAGTVEVAAELPVGPSRGQVRDLPAGAATEEQVVRLAAALGVDGPAERADDRWQVAAGGTVLVVSDTAGTPWQLSTPAGDPPVLTLPGAPDASVSSPGGPSRATPGLRAVTRAASQVLAAIGLRGAEVRFGAGPGTRDVVAAPVVDRLPTAGMDTWLRYGPGARLIGAAGWLGTPAAAGQWYPLIPAEEALATLPAGPEIAVECGSPMCGPRVVVGARPGLLLRQAAGAAVVLVPAWLFTLRGGGAPLAAIAVDPDFLTRTAPEPDRSAAPPPGPGASVDPAPGTVDPGAADSQADDGAAGSNGSTGAGGPPASPRPTR